MSQLEVDKVIPQSGTTLTLGESGDTVSIPSGATFTPTLTAPIIDEINDNNGNEEIIFTTTTSAVNELTIANAATGNAPEIAATGDDTDIDLKLTPKGAGNLVLDGIEFPNADGTAGQFLQTNGSGVLSFAGGGKVLQVVNATTTTETATTSSSYQATTLTVSITPSNSANKVLIQAQYVLNASTTDNWADTTLYRGASNLAGANGCVGVYVDASQIHVPASITFLDSPSTTSSTTYTVRIRSRNNSGNTRFNADNFTASIVAMEISA
jgi:hypothetical protein